MPQPPSLEVYVRDRIATLQSSVSRVKTRPHAISQLHSAGALLFHYPVFMPAPAWELLHVGNQCDNTRSKLRTFKLTSLSSFPGWLMESFTCQRSLMSEVTRYCHIGSQRGGIPMQPVWARRPRSEGGVEGTGPSGMQMWSSPGRLKRVVLWVVFYFYQLKPSPWLGFKQRKEWVKTREELKKLREPYIWILGFAVRGDQIR